jgi:ribosomal protein S18 acetylase RimI-like enzyme
MAVRRVVSTTRVLKAVTRSAGAEDLSEVTRLLSTLGSGASEEVLAQFLRAGGQVVVATVLGEVAGVAVLEWLHPIQSPRAEAWLTSLVTGAQFRHRGVARALLEECARRVRQAGGDRIHVTAALERDEVSAFLRAAAFEPRLIVYERSV